MVPDAPVVSIVALPDSDQLIAGLWADFHGRASRCALKRLLLEWDGRRLFVVYVPPVRPFVEVFVDRS
jgi:hypothetical protein